MKHYISVAEYAQRRGISRQAVLKQINAGKLKTIRIGKVYGVQV